MDQRWVGVGGGRACINSRIPRGHTRRFDRYLRLSAYRISPHPPLHPTTPFSSSFFTSGRLLIFSVHASLKSARGTAESAEHISFSGMGIWIYWRFRMKLVNCIWWDCKGNFVYKMRQGVVMRKDWLFSSGRIEISFDRFRELIFSNWRNIIFKDFTDQIYKCVSMSEEFGIQDSGFNLNTILEISYTISVNYGYFGFCKRQFSDKGSLLNNKKSVANLKLRILEQFVEFEIPNGCSK